MSVVTNAGSPGLVVQVVEAKAATNDDHAVSCLMLVHNCQSLHHSAWFVAVALRSRRASCALSDSNTMLEGGLHGTLSLHQPQTPDPGVYATLHSSDRVCSAPADHSLLPAKPLAAMPTTPRYFTYSMLGLEQRCTPWFPPCHQRPDSGVIRFSCCMCAR